MATRIAPWIALLLGLVVVAGALVLRIRGGAGVTGDLLAWGTLLLGLTATVISVAGFVQSNRVAKRESYVVAREILTDLTTGEVATARDVIGTLRHGTVVAWKSLDYSDVVRQFYCLEWTLERTGFGYMGLRPAGHQVQDSMRDAIKWHVRELSTAVATLREAFGRDMVDADSWRTLDRVLAAVGVEDAKPTEDEIRTIRSRLDALKAQKPR